MLPSVVESISESFKAVIRSAKERGDREIVIFEDDICFVSENGWRYFLDNKPDDFDVYIGGNYIHDNRIEYKPPLIKVKEWVGNQMILISEKYFDIWLNTDSHMHCDGAQIGLGDFYVCFPYPGIQRSGWSANNQSVVNYNANIPPEFIYK